MQREPASFIVPGVEVLKPILTNTKSISLQVYYQEDNIMVITLSRKQVDHGIMEGNFVVNCTKSDAPVSIEILDAGRFLAEQSRVLPDSVKQKYFPTLTA